MSIATEIQRITQAKAGLKTAIEAKGVGIADTDTIDTYANKVAEIQVGGGDYDEGYAQGRTDEWSGFWDNYQQNGEKTDYGKMSTFNGAFASSSWNDNNFKPKYDIQPITAYGMFCATDITDLSNLNIVLDFSQCTDPRQLFYSSKVQRLGIIDLTANTYQNSNIFYGATELESIAKLILKEGKYANTYNNMFIKCDSLTDVDVEGVINQSIDLSYSPLTAKSAKSFINCLENYAGTENEFVYSVYFSETTWSYLDAEGETASPNGNSWRDYIFDLGYNT